MTRPTSYLLTFATLTISVLAQSSGLQNGLSDAHIAAVVPGGAPYDAARRAYNLRYDFSPVAVTYPSTAEQVATIVALGNSENIQVVARSGGHNYIANGLGGKNGSLVIDLSNMTRVDVDVSSGTATIETGNRLGDVAFALNNQGRALPHGSCPYVGIGGHVSGGGFGFTSRMWGLTLDAVQSMSVVLANGTIVTASSNSNADLFWAMRGAASSFGIITSIDVKTFPTPPFATIYEYDWQLDYSSAATALAKFQEYVMTDIPPQLGAEINLGRGNSEGSVYFGLTGGWYGESTDALQSALAPFLASMPSANVRYSGNGTYISTIEALGNGIVNTNVAGPDTTDTFYAKSLVTPEGQPMTLEALEAFMKYLAYDGYASNTAWFMQFELYGGGNSFINSINVDSTAFATRSALFTVQLYASSSNYEPPYPEDGFTFLDGAVEAITSTMGDDWDYGAYVNYPDDRLNNAQSLYYKSHYTRLESLKSQYDPTGVFVFPISVQ
ncbi:glucooligosaccharide oxidase [Guyanagaster necrorhizus]|uniref:Glucooligosaccharide oxidase n=1 Tax=Guyanagaster necrorhizus TaxID=856835 RepID=A0A9P7VVY0_9AGAR|nr:glucooligosaccharide oxidase [Guyanagaster necrorhizus MCA 3950]KAG7447578.1 glucooligosaccharide oxidase [Guyanagaster necrorhizus MCA 3950]